MDNQGFYGALVQFWTIDEKPRLHRRNTWFEDHQPSRTHLRILLFVSVFVVVAFMVSVILGGLL